MLGCGARQSVLQFAVPAFSCSVVDTTGCGDAYAAGFIVGLGFKWDLGTSARLGTAAAALVAQGLGSDAGIVDLESTLAFWGSKAEEVGCAPPQTTDVSDAALLGDGIRD